MSLNATKSWKHAVKYAFTLNKTMPNLVQNSLQLSWKFKGKLTRSLMNDDADWMGLSFEMPFKTRYHTWKQSRFIIFSFFCENGKNQFTQKFIQLCRRNFSNFNSCFFFCLKELCQQSNVLFCLLHRVLVSLFFNECLNGAFQRSKPWTSHVRFKSRSETRNCALVNLSFVFAIGRAFLH